MVPPGFEDLDALRAERRPVGVDARLASNTEPLRRDGAAILEAGITDIAHRNFRVPREFIGDPMRIGIGLPNLQPVVFAVATELDSQLLSDLEVYGRRTDAPDEQRIAERTGPVGK